MIRKYISIGLIVVLVLIMATPVACAESYSTETAAPVEITISEFDMLGKLAEIPAEQLKEAGYTSEQVAEIKNYKAAYSEHIQELSGLEDSTLIKFGYSEEQIEMIHNFTGSDAELMALDAEVNLNAYTRDFRWASGDYTRGTLFYEWEWTGLPLAKSTDLIAAGWTGFAVEESLGVNKYYDMTTGDYVTLQSATARYPGDDPSSYATSGKGYEIPLRPINTNNFAMNGNGYFVVRSISRVATDFYYHVAYGHTVLTVDIGFSLDPTNPVTLQFSSGMNKETYKNGRVIPDIS